MADQISFARGAPSLDIVDVEGLKAAAAEAFTTDPAGTTAYGTAIGYPPLRKWIAERHQVAPENVIVTNGSMQADAFLFDALVEPGDSVIVERPTYDRTLLSLRKRGADVRMVELETDGIDVAARRARAGGRRQAEARPHHPELPEPRRLHAVGAQARAAARARAQARVHGVRGRPVRRAALRGHAAADDALDGRGDNVVYASSFSKTVCPGIRVGYLVGPTELIARIVKIATNTYISPSMVSQSIVYNFCTSGALERSIETVKGGAARARRRRCARRFAAKLPDARFDEPQGGYFLWVDLPRGTDVDAMFTRRRRARRAVRQGHRLRARGRRDQPAPRLLRRHARADRRGRRPARGRLPRGDVRRHGVAARVLAAVALAAEHQLLGQRRARRRRRVGDHRDGLGDARGDRRACRRRLETDTVSPSLAATLPSSPGSIPASFR